ncbi:hypothetical protein KY317_03790 [Candidatus Woesearchaeota archaeon]|nr:hypothetical protein [Candidatus Woesearchaeota archaeon]
MNSGKDKTNFITYESDGIGDMRLIGWADITEWFSPLLSPEEEEEEIPEEFLEELFEDADVLAKELKKTKDRLS